MNGGAVRSQDLGPGLPHPQRASSPGEAVAVVPGTMVSFSPIGVRPCSRRRPASVADVGEYPCATIGLLILAAATAGDGYGYSKPNVGLKKLFRPHVVMHGPPLRAV